MKSFGGRYWGHQAELLFYGRNPFYYRLSHQILIKLPWNSCRARSFFMFFFGNYIILFFRDIIIRNIFGSEFVEAGEAGVISTSPILPNNIQLMILIILQIIIVGPCEESFFRGFLIQKLKTKLKLAYSIIISSFFFALYHLPPFLVPVTTIITFFGYYFTFGLILSLIFIYFDFSLIPCSTAHSLFNILILIIWFLRLRKILNINLTKIN